MKKIVRKPKVSVFCDIYPPPMIGGAEGTVANFVSCLASRGVEVKVHTITSDSKEEFVQTHRILNFYTPFETKPPKPVRLIWHVLELWNPFEVIRTAILLKRDAPQFIMCHNSYFWSWTPILVGNFLRIPTAIFVHDYGLICFRRTLWNEKKKNDCIQTCGACRIRRNFSKKIISRAKFIFFNSHSTKNIFLKNYDEDCLYEKGIVVYPLITKDIHIPRIQSASICEEADFIGFIGRISPEKGVEDLLKAATRIGVRVDIAGSGNREYIEDLNKRYSYGVFMGFVEKNLFFSSQSIIVIPSKWMEPFGKVVIEALQVGMKVVLPNSGAFSELIGLLKDLEGKTIFSYSPMSIENLEFAIVSALRSKTRDIHSETRELFYLPEWDLNDLADFIKKHSSSSLSGRDEF